MKKNKILSSLSKNDGFIHVLFEMHNAKLSIDKTNPYVDLESIFSSVDYTFKISQQSLDSVRLIDVKRMNNKGFNLTLDVEKTLFLMKTSTNIIAIGFQLYLKNLQI